MTFYFDHQLYLLFHQNLWKPDRKTWVNKRPFAIEYIYTMHNKFSNFLCFASLCAHICAMSNNFKCNGENRILGKVMKPRIYRRHPLNRHLGRARIAGGVNKQK